MVARASARGVVDAGARVPSARRTSVEYATRRARAIVRAEVGRACSSRLASFHDSGRVTRSSTPATSAHTATLLMPGESTVENMAKPAPFHGLRSSLARRAMCTPSMATSAVRATSAGVRVPSRVGGRMGGPLVRPRQAIRRAAAGPVVSRWSPPGRESWSAAATRCARGRVRRSRSTRGPPRNRTLRRTPP